MGTGTQDAVHVNQQDKLRADQCPKVNHASIVETGQIALGLACMSNSARDFTGERRGNELRQAPRRLTWQVLPMFTWLN